MNLQQIQELIKLLDDSNIGEFKLKSSELTIRIRTKSYFDGLNESKNMASLPPFPAHFAQYVPPPAVSVQPTPAPSVETTIAPIREAPPAPPSVPTSPSTLIIRSPMIGTFYRAPEPGKDPFVKIGDTIAQGDPVCIIEAMKLFNSVDSEYSGTIVRVLVNDATPVEYDQPLFELQP